MEVILTTLLAPVAGGKRYWVRAPQGTVAPYLVLNKIDDIPDYTMQGASGYSEKRFQIDIYTTTFTSLTALANEVKTILSGYKDGDAVQAIFIDSERNLPAADAGDVTNLFRTSIDIIVHHGE